MNNFFEKLNNSILFFVGYTLIFTLFFNTLSYTLPFVLAILAAFILQKPTAFLIKKYNLKNTTASLLTTFVFFSTLLSLLSWAVILLSQQAIELGKSAETYIALNEYKFVDLLTKIKFHYNNLDPTITSAVQQNFMKSINQLSSLTVTLTGNIISGVLNFLASVPYMLMVILFTLIATYFFTKDYKQARVKMKKLIPNSSTDRAAFIISETKRMLGNYVFSYLIIITITFSITLIGFSLFRVPYAFLLSLLSGLFDFVPILGIGAIYVPVSIVYILNGNYMVGVGLLLLYFAITIERHIIEPKIVSSSLGLHPVSVLAAIFIGLKANGISGMFFCIFLVVFYNIFKKINIL